MSSGLILLGQIAHHGRTLDVLCTRCDRRGRLSMARLLREFGPQAPVWRAIEHLNDDCAWKASNNIYQQCSLACPQLPEWTRPGA